MRLQFISELDITGGDENKVGYYAGEQKRLRAIRNLDSESLF